MPADPVNPTSVDTAAMKTAPPSDEAVASIPLRHPGWKHILMVCKACEKRSKGPKKFGAKQLSKALSPALRQARLPKTRVVYTTCLGLCPKKAVAVATTAADGAVNSDRVAQVRRPTGGGGGALSAGGAPRGFSPCGGVTGRLPA